MIPLQNSSQILPENIKKNIKSPKILSKANVATTQRPFSTKSTWRILPMHNALVQNIIKRVCNYQSQF